MQKFTLTLTVVMLLLGITAANAAAQTTLSVTEWFADNTFDISWGSGITVSPKTSINLTRIAGAYDVTDKIEVNGSYAFGTTDKFTFNDKSIAVDVQMLQIGGNYEIKDGVRLGVGYLSNAFDDTNVSGIYAEATGTLPLADNLTLTGKVAYSPLLDAETESFREEATLAAVDLGLSYNWNDFAITGGYRYEDYSLDVSQLSGSYNFSGMYVGAAYNF